MRSTRAPEIRAGVIHLEHALEKGEGQTGNGQAIPDLRQTLQQSKREGVPHHRLSGAAISESQAEAKGGPDQGGDAHHHEAHRHRVEDIPPLNKAAVEEGQTRGHQQNHRCRDQQQGVVRAVQRGLSGLGWQEDTQQELKRRNREKSDQQSALSRKKPHSSSFGNDGYRFRQQGAQTVQNEHFYPS